MYILVLLKFTPLEFETIAAVYFIAAYFGLKFTPLEFETAICGPSARIKSVKIYSVGV